MYPQRDHPSRPWGSHPDTVAQRNIVIRSAINRDPTCVGKAAGWDREMGGGGASKEADGQERGWGR